jgi:hypothetical protein
LKKGSVLPVSRLKIEIFEDCAECSGFSPEGADEIILELSEKGEIPVSFGTHIKVARGGSLRFQTSLLPDGIYPVSLFVNGGAHTVAELEKRHGILSLLPPKDDFIREVSVRERQLARRVERLEESLRLLLERMNGTPLFKQN